MSSPVRINALRLFTPDGRVLISATGRESVLTARTSATLGQAETFGFLPPTAWPLRSGDAIALAPYWAGWVQQQSQLRVEHTTLSLPTPRKGERLVTYEVGGPGARVLVWGAFSAGYPGYPGDDEAERIFRLVKLVNGMPAADGTPLASGDMVAVRIDSNRGRTFFFRVTGAASGAEIHGDGTTTNQGDTAFRVEFNEVRTPLGWRPADAGACQQCAQVTVRVVKASGQAPIAGATVTVNVAGHPYTGVTGADGRVVVADAEGRRCVPQGMTSVTAAADRHRTETIATMVPGSGAIEVTVPLGCTEVSGVVVDSTGNGVPGKLVMLQGADGTPLRDASGAVLQTTTDSRGAFTFRCVPHGFVRVWTLADPMQMQHINTIGPDGWTTVRIVIQATCGDIVGRVVDGSTNMPVAGATVTESATGRTTTTDANGAYRFTCVRPSGNVTIIALAPGYGAGVATGTVPGSGDSLPIVVVLTPQATAALEITLDWGIQPSDLDLHCSGPDGRGGRFHVFFANLSPEPFVALDQDDTTALGPETIRILPDPSLPMPAFQAGDYRVWVHNFSGSTFVSSNATVTLSQRDAAGALTQVAFWQVTMATGNPSDDIWHVANLAVDAAGGVVPTTVQLLMVGDSMTQP